MSGVPPTTTTTAYMAAAEPPPGASAPGLKQVPLSKLIYELGPQAFVRFETFLAMLKTPKPGPQSNSVEPAILISEREVAESILCLLSKQQAEVASAATGALTSSVLLDVPIEQFVDAIGCIKPYLAWVDVFSQVGQFLYDKPRLGGDSVMITENGWLLILRAWQRARRLLERVAIRQRLGATLDGQNLPPISPEPVPASQRTMFPLSVLPSRPSNRLLSSLVKFLVSHDERHNSTLIPQTLLETPPSNVLLEVAHSLFYTHAEEAHSRHGLDLLSFLTRRLQNPKESDQFLMQIAVFLHEKLTALMNLYVAASEGRDPFQSIDTQTTLILDSSKTITYFQAVMNFADAADAQDMLFSDQRVVHHFEKLRLMAVDVYREDAAAAGLDRRNFLTYLSADRRYNEPPAPQAARPIDPQQMPPSHLMSTQEQAAPAGPYQRPAPSPSNIESQEEYLFSCFYRRELSASQLVELLGRLAACPPNSSEALLLSKMLRTLFTECRFFPRYPPSELHRTADFFGKLIRSELLFKRPELQVLATRCVMEALKKDPTSNIFKFGLTALAEFIDITPASPVFLASLTKMQGLIEYFPEIVTWAQQCLSVMPPKIRSMSLIEMPALLQAIAPQQLPPCHNLFTIPPNFRLVPPPQPQPPALQAVMGITAPRTGAPDGLFGHVPPPLGQATSGTEYCVKLQGFGLGQVEALMEDVEITRHIEDPPDTVKNRVAQVFNTLAKSNITQKVAELLRVLKAEYHAWLAFYIVKSRASKEPNHHELYAEFAEHLGHNRMLELLTNVTYDCVNLLLKFAVSAREATSYRTVVKTLGSWLGRLTLARNKPLKSKSMDLKAMLFDSYERGICIVTVPLTCALLAHIKNSRTFRLPNPWTAQALFCLGNLYQVPNIKQTIHFEIELLMRNLELDLTHFIGHDPNLFLSLTPPTDSPDLQTTSSVAASSSTPSIAPTKLSPQLDPAPVATASDETVPSAAAPRVLASDPQLPGDPAGTPSAEQALLGGPTSGGQLMNALSKSVSIAPHLVIFQRHPELRIAVSLAIERAIRQLVGVISERAVILAVGTTVELVQKDFALESDPDLVKRAGNLMAAALGGSIVSVTGRSPLRLAIIEHFKDLIKSTDNLTTSDSKDDDLVNQTAQVIANDNLNLGSLLIEQVVVEKSIKAVQEALADSLEQRRLKHTAGESYVDPVYYKEGATWPRALPPMLQLTPNINQQRLQIYHDFVSVGPWNRQRRNTPVQQEAGAKAAAGVVAASTLVKPNGAPMGHSQARQPLSTMPIASNHISPKRLLKTEQSLAAIDQAVAALKEGVKELIASPLINGVVTGSDPVIPTGHMDHLMATPPGLSPALRALATLPINHEVFNQMEIVVRLIQHCEQQDDVALSTARRLLKSIYDAATRAVQHASAGGDSEIDISLIYLEAFMALLKKFDEIQLVHRLKDVVTIWIVSASYLALSSQTALPAPAGQDSATTEKTSIDFRHFPVENAAHSSLVLSAAWKYQLLQGSVIDKDYLSVLLRQSFDAILKEGSEMAASTKKAAEITIEFALSVVYALSCDLGVEVAATLKNTQVLISDLNTYLTNCESSAVGTAASGEPFRWLTNVKLQLPRLLEFQVQAAAEEWTIGTLMTKINGLQAGKSESNVKANMGILTIQDLMAYRTRHGVHTYSYISAPAVRASSSVEEGAHEGGAVSSTLAQAYQNGQLKSKQAISSAIANSVRESLRAK
eukprot:Blabericola_migrator_1__4642@NODE_245_length_10909_cov_149_723298_g207_i0_p1_GENE_NODE_245_length_10909_cov_149_723298_g207_i0NODE_245_length_10909_cov_149_723298_g207_i0_p1_ORF_typecomplete_len1725_score275_85CNOT1_CAF1_bind/PF16415_5/4_6e64CNOT1_CAF1_bind/PF16415_5/3_2e03CNOT1_TTP_bind/PF16417_5/1_7e32DUF3819/PF12842_7/4_3e32_NODE_245_length_10909_cov_149_723298_g207_i030858259